MISLLLVLCLLLPGQVLATTYWDDELESGDTGYTLPGDGSMSFDTSRKFSGNGSLKLHYDSSCYPDGPSQCGGFMDRSFTPTNHLFIRFYFYLPSSFTVGNTETKMLTILPTGSTTYDILWEMLNGNMELSASMVRALDGQQEIHDATGSIPTDQWVCFQLEQQLNTIGSANGIVRAWMDGVQVLNHTNMTVLVSGDSNTHFLETHRFFRQVGLGDLWYDKFAVGDAQIPCVGGGGGGSTAGGGLDF